MYLESASFSAGSKITLTQEDENETTDNSTQPATSWRTPVTETPSASRQYSSAAGGSDQYLGAEFSTGSQNRLILTHGKRQTGPEPQKKHMPSSESCGSAVTNPLIPAPHQQVPEHGHFDFSNHHSQHSIAWPIFVVTDCFSLPPDRLPNSCKHMVVLRNFLNGKLKWCLSLLEYSQHSDPQSPNNNRHPISHPTDS